MHCGKLHVSCWCMWKGLVFSNQSLGNGTRVSDPSAHKQRQLLGRLLHLHRLDQKEAKQGWQRTWHIETFPTLKVQVAEGQGTLVLKENFFTFAAHLKQIQYLLVLFICLIATSWPIGKQRFPKALDLCCLTSELDWPRLSDKNIVSRFRFEYWCLVAWAL